MERPLPRTDAPALTVNLAGGSSAWSLHEQSPEHFTMVVFYRGLHCPVCRSYLETLQSKRGDFAERGVEVLAVSMDTEERAQKAIDKWSIGKLTVGYGLNEQQAQEWGLFLSRGIKDLEPDLFSEPGLFLVQPDGTLYYAAINSMPFGRPALDDLLGGVDFVLESAYPARGEMLERTAAL